MTQEGVTAESQSIPGAVCHEIMKRILPMLGHDIIGALSIAKMQVFLAQKKINTELGTEKKIQEEALEAINTHLKKAIMTTRALSIWGRPIPRQINIDEAIHECIRLSKNLLGQQHLSIEYEPTNGLYDNLINGAGFHYAVLAIVAYWQDLLNGQGHLSIKFANHPVQIIFTIQQSEEQAIFKTLHPIDLEDIEDAQASMGRFIIDEYALKSLLNAFQWKFELQNTTMTIELPLYH